MSCVIRSRSGSHPDTEKTGKFFPVVDQFRAIDNEMLGVFQDLTPEAAAGIGSFVESELVLVEAVVAGSDAMK